jgi:carbon-monoxide dehydrogenase large subunit
MGLAPALYEEISYDKNGNVQGGSFMDYLVPTAMETPAWEIDRTVTPSPHHPFARRVSGSRRRWARRRRSRTRSSMHYHTSA